MESWLRALYWLIAIVLFVRAVSAALRGRIGSQGEVIRRAEHPSDYRFELILAFLTPLLIVLVLVAASRRHDDHYSGVTAAFLPLLLESLMRDLRTGRSSFGERTARSRGPFRFWVDIGVTAALVATLAALFLR